MLTETKYTTGQAIAESLKYNTAYNKAHLFNVICSGLASRLLGMGYSEILTEEQKALLTKIAEE